MADRLARWSPVVLVWLAVTLVLAPFAGRAPRVPFTDVSVLSHKPGGAATASLLVLAVLWLVPGQEHRRGRVAWSCLALMVIALIATQNRGALLGIMAGGAVALAFMADRARVVLWVLAGISHHPHADAPAVGEGPLPRCAGARVLRAAARHQRRQPHRRGDAGNLGGTVDGRKQLWTLVLDKQASERRVLTGAGFGPNLAAEVGVLDDGEDSLRNPHNTHLSVLARMGAVGALLWVAFWVAWYWRVAAASRRLRHTSRHADGQLGGVCLTVATTVLVASVFDPQLEGPQVAVLLWSLVGIGLAVTGRRP